MWRDCEVNALLDAWSNDAIQRQLSGSYRNEPVYHKIEAELAKWVVQREWKQCRDKLKALNKKYKDVVVFMHQHWTWASMYAHTSVASPRYSLLSKKELVLGWQLGW